MSSSVLLLLVGNSCRVMKRPVAAREATNNCVSRRQTSQTVASVSAVTDRSKAFEKISDFDTVAFSLVCDKYCPIIN